MQSRAGGKRWKPIKIRGSHENCARGAINQEFGRQEIGWGFRVNCVRIRSLIKAGSGCGGLPAIATQPETLSLWHFRQAYLIRSCWITFTRRGF
jgi:hypothetical protein